MSTILAAVMCLLYDSASFEQAHRSLNTELYHKRFCKNKNEMSSLRPHLRKYPNTTVMAVVRDPLDRFISGFMDKCVREAIKIPERCYGCNKNLTCFMNRQYHRMHMYETGEISHISFEDIHFNPQNWHCNFRDISSSIKVIKYGSDGVENRKMIEEFTEILTLSEVDSNLIKTIQMNLTATRTPHATAELDERKLFELQLRSDPKLMELLVQMFYYDYVLFGFELPQTIHIQ